MTNQSQTKLDFLMSREFITILAAVVSVINGVNIVGSSLSKTPLNLQVTIGGVLIFFMVIYLTYIRWKIEPKLNLIKKYCFLMGYLKPLVCIDNTCNKNISDVIRIVYDFPPRPSPCWKIYFESSFKNVNTQFNKLNMTLNRLKDFPYLLVYPKNINSIRYDFTKLFNDMESLYKGLYLTRFDSKISNSIDFVKIGNEYNALIQKLKDSQQEFEEIKNDIKKVLTFQELLIDDT